MFAGFVAGFVAEAVLAVSKRGPESVTGPTQALSGMPVPEIGRPASGAVTEGSTTDVPPEPPLTPTLSVREPGVRLPPPRMYFWSTPGSPVRFAGRSMKALSPGPG